MPAETYYFPDDLDEHLASVRDSNDEYENKSQVLQAIVREHMGAGE